MLRSRSYLAAKRSRYDRYLRATGKMGLKKGGALVSEDYRGGGEGWGLENREEASTNMR
jgi:hypothetical protein